MQTLVIYGKLQKHDVFRKFIEEHPESYLVHYFIMYNDAQLDSVHLGFYQPKQDLIASFIIEKDNVVLNPGDEIFKEDEKPIAKLELEKVAVDIPDALQKAKDVMKEKYGFQGNCIRTIMILQVLSDIPTYNITFLTSSFKTVNIKLNAMTSEVISDAVQNLLDFKS